MRVKLTGVNVDGNFEPIPAGIYDLMLVNNVQKTSKSGNEYMNCEFAVIGGKYEGRRVWDTIVFMESTLWKLKSFALAIGYPEIDREDGVDTEDLFMSALNTPIKAKIIVDTYSDKSGNKQANNKVEEYIFGNVEPQIVKDSSDVPF